MASEQTGRHFTVAVFVVWEGKVLLHRHRKLGMWLPPGGHIEENELPDEAAVREVLEEVGCRARITRYADRVAYDADGDPKVVFFWHMEPVEHVGDPAEDEIDRVEWLALDDALERLAALNERWVRIVEHRFFAGLTAEETAAVMGVSLRTVEREWRAARAWLAAELSGGAGR